MYKKTILIVDDEIKILKLMRSYLEANGYNVLCAQNGGEGMSLFENNRIALIILDLMLPDFSGEEFCKKIRKISDIPIIMATAKVEEENIVYGLNIGADDYVIKPFSPRQLVARVQSALRRSSAQKSDKKFSLGDLVIDTQKRIVSRLGKEISLTRSEYNILALLISRQTKIWTRDEIIEAVKGGDFIGFDRSIDSHIKRLRAKIGDDTKYPRYILTVYGMGYRLGEFKEN